MNYRNLIHTSMVFAIIAFMIARSQNEMSMNEVIVNSDTTLIIYKGDTDKNAPPCLQMYYAIEKYSTEYNIPKKYAYGVAYKETRYEGPFHWQYKHSQASYAGAIGPMQIMLPTAQSQWPELTVSAKKLMHDIDFNVHTSMKVLRKLFDKYKDWKIVFGCYNTGRPIVNGYAEDVFNFKINFRRYE